MKKVVIFKTPENLEQLKQTYKDNYLIYYTPLEELLNTLTHAIGLLFGLIGLFFLLSVSKTPIAIITSIIFTFCFCSLFLASTLYHGITNIKYKKILRRIDYAFVNLMVISCGISASLVYKTKIGYLMLGLTGVIFILMLILCLLDFKRFRIVTVCSNVVSGAFMSIPIIINRAKIPEEALIFYIIGLAIILIGFSIFGLKKRYVHALFHLFILFGTILMYFCNYIIIKTL